MARNQITDDILGVDISSFGISSSPEEWEKFARSLFEKKRYAHAMECFQKASLHREAGVANAYYLRKKAGTTPSGQGSNLRRKRAFVIAADAFVDCAFSAALDSEKPFYYRSAAQCFEQCGKAFWRIL